MTKYVYQVRDVRLEKNNDSERSVTTTYGSYTSVEEALEKRENLIQAYLADGEDFYTADKDSDFAPKISSDSDETHLHKIQIIRRYILQKERP